MSYTDFISNIGAGANTVKASVEIAKGTYGNGNADKAFSGIADLYNVVLDIVTKGKNPAGMTKAAYDLNKYYNEAKGQIESNEYGGKIKDSTYLNLLSSGMALISYGSAFYGMKNGSPQAAEFALLGAAVSAGLGLLGEFTENSDSTVIDDTLLSLYDLTDELFNKFGQPQPLGKLFYISDEEVYEYEGKVVFYVTNLTDKTMELDLSTINGSANEKDYEPISIPKVLEAHQTIPVEITIKNNDDDDKRIENFYLSGRITNPQDFENEVGDSNFVYTDKGTCTIFDKNYVDIKISRPVVMENEEKATFVITLSKELDEPLKLKATTMDGSAKDKIDYNALIGQEFEIPAGVTSWEFDINIVNDEELEENPIVEDFMFILEPNDAEQARKYDLDPQYFSYAKIIDDDPSIEFAILSDTTGSMGGAINSVKAQALDIVNLAFARDPNARIGVFGYNDPDVQTFTNLTNDKSTVISAINSLYAIDGGDIPEMTYHGIYNAANSNWSENSVKRIFIFGDAPAKDEYFKETALAALKSNGITIEVFAIQTGGGSDVTDEFKELAEASGGTYVNLATSGYDSVADTLFDMMNTGTNKDETIIGNDKNNTINGKGGDDILEGGLGSDIYEFDDNFGNDTIIETNSQNSDKNGIKFTNLTTIKDLIFTQNGNDLIINHTNKQNSITVKDFYLDENKISFLEFADGFGLSNTDLKDFAFMQNNKSNLHYAEANEPNLNENLKSVFFMADTGISSNISGGMLNDSLIGSDKSDNIWGGYGDDILIGRKGDDTLNGGAGNDKYIYSKFDGNDTIQDNGGSDTLVLRGINKNEAIFAQLGKDLVISFTFNNDKIIVKNHFKGLLKSNRIENIIFDENENLSVSQIDNFIANSKFKNEFGTKIFENETPNFNKIASELAFRFGNETAINSSKFANFTYSDNSGYISANQIDKIIEQVNSYSDDKGLGNFAFDDMKNSMNLQIYG